MATKPDERTLLTGLAFGESPRWHEGRLWVANWGTQEILAIDAAGRSEVVVRVATTLPYSIDWLPDGRLLVVSGQERLVLRLEPDGARDADGHVRQGRDFRHRQQRHAYGRRQRRSVCFQQNDRRPHDYGFLDDQ